MECNGIDFNAAVVELIKAIIETLEDIFSEIIDMLATIASRVESEGQRHKWFLNKQFCGYKNHLENESHMRGVVADD